MRGRHLKSLGVELNEVMAALAGEHRRRVRKRLLALRAILAGKSIDKAARAARTTPDAIERWLNRVRQSGFQSLLRDPRRRRPKWQRMTARRVQTLRRKIAAALARPLKPQTGTRLVAIDAVLSGQPIEKAATAARVLRNTAGRWLRAVARDGIGPALTRWEAPGPPRPRQLEADPAALRELAAKERNPRIRKRILALACVADGMSPFAASVKAGLSRNDIAKWIKRFQEEGPAGLQDKKIEGRPYRLSSAGFQELRHEVLQRPEMSYRELELLVWTRFHVRCSSESLARLLKKKLGIVWHAGKFWPAEAWAEHRSILEQKTSATRAQAIGADTKA